ncbi:MAG TPA: prolipoprotein diacylglyceryl transferase [Candidatus Acidoferrales bacterium]
MYPFIHLGPVTLGTYGLMVATGLICAFFVMRADIRRRGLDVDAESIIGITGLAGLAGARLYHLLESPAEFFANPLPLLFSTTGFAWFGALIGGFTALVLLARSYRMKILLMLDVASPAAAVGYGIGRIGCLISGDGDYGTPTSLPWGMSFPNGLVPTTDRVHPTPIYEFLVALAIAYFLWRIGSRAIQDAHGSDPASQEASHPAGEVFAWYLIATGIARFLVEFIRINPRSFFGLTNAQTASVASVLSGALLLLVLKSGSHDPRKLPPADPRRKISRKASRKASAAT